MEIWLYQECGDLERWLGTEPYRSLMPSSATEPNRALFLCDIEAVLASFRNRHAPEGRSRSKAWTREVLAAIKRDNTRNLKALSAELGVTAETLGEAFRARTGLRFRKYAQIVRFLKAVGNLANPERSIKEAAGLANYPEPSVFARDCRELLGVNPLELHQRLSVLADMCSD